MRSKGRVKSTLPFFVDISILNCRQGAEIRSVIALSFSFDIESRDLMIKFMKREPGSCVCVFCICAEVLSNEETVEYIYGDSDLILYAFLFWMRRDIEFYRVRGSGVQCQLELHEQPEIL